MRRCPLLLFPLAGVAAAPRPPPHHPSVAPVSLCFVDASGRSGEPPRLGGFQEGLQNRSDLAARGLQAVFVCPIDEPDRTSSWLVKGRELTLCRGGAIPSLAQN